MVRPPPTERMQAGQQPGRTPLQEHLGVEPVHGDQLRRRALLEGVCPIDQDQRALAGLLPAEPQGPHAPTPSRIMRLTREVKSRPAPCIIVG